MNIGFLTTSRADFGIYSPLIRAVERIDGLSYSLFVGGSHLSEKFGLTYHEIEKQGFVITAKTESLVDDDSAVGVATMMGDTTSKFSNTWSEFHESLDLLFILGDRFEMFAAAAATIPFNLKLAHLHGGETTLGAIDNKFRNAMTAMSTYHFTSTKGHAERVIEIAGSGNNVHNVGALGVEAIAATTTITNEDFKSKFDFDISEPYILSTYHPETVNLGDNAKNIQEVIKAFEIIPEPVLCSLPNADTEGNIIREALLKYEQLNPNRIKCVENLGQIGYYTAIEGCLMMIGNTSSGIIEAASFQKPVVNVGSRQGEREHGNNIIHAGNSADSIVKAYQGILQMDVSQIENIYGDDKVSARIIEVLLAL